MVSQCALGGLWGSAGIPGGTAAAVGPSPHTDVATWRQCGSGAALAPCWVKGQARSPRHMYMCVYTSAVVAFRESLLEANGSGP